MATRIQKYCTRFNAATVLMNQVTVVERLRAHVGELLVAIQAQRGGESGQIELQQFRRQPFDFHAAQRCSRENNRGVASASSVGVLKADNASR